MCASLGRSPVLYPYVLAFFDISFLLFPFCFFLWTFPLPCIFFLDLSLIVTFPLLRTYSMKTNVFCTCSSPPFSLSFFSAVELLHTPTVPPHLLASNEPWIVLSFSVSHLTLAFFLLVFLPSVAVLFRFFPHSTTTTGFLPPLRQVLGVYSALTPPSSQCLLTFCGRFFVHPRFLCFYPPMFLF